MLSKSVSKIKVSYISTVSKRNTPVVFLGSSRNGRGIDGRGVISRGGPHWGFLSWNVNQGGKHNSRTRLVAV